MNITLIGYGRMGKEVEAQALARGHRIMHRFTESDALAQADLGGTDVAIEFTKPDAAVGNIELLATKGITTVVGTTGWYDDLPRVRAVVEKHGISFLSAPNFSLGVHLFLRILGEAALLVDACPEYDVFGNEEHHARKADAPSGTALKAAEVLLGRIRRKKTLVTEALHRAPLPEELHFTSTRGGSVPGTHRVFFDSPADTIELSHTARSRQGFALGAVRAAEWLAGKRGFRTMDEFLSDLLSAPPMSQ